MSPLNQSPIGRHTEEDAQTSLALPALLLQVQAVWPAESDVATFFLVKLLHIVQTFFVASADRVTAALVGPTLHTLGPVAFHVWKQDVSQRDKESAWIQLSSFLLSLPASGEAAFTLHYITLHYITCSTQKHSGNRIWAASLVDTLVFVWRLFAVAASVR
jgi:hypothetical protein